MRRSAEEQLVKYLTDAHAVEVQALAQMRAAPRIAADDRLGGAFRAHLIETEGHERALRGRLAAHRASPSRPKDVAGRVGAWGMVLFARGQPDSTGKLTAHAFSYESMEVATYGLLQRAAEAAGDEETAAVAVAVGAEEREMAERLGSLFDNAVEAGLREVRSNDLDAHLDRYLKDAHALEQQGEQLLRVAARLVDDDGLASLFAAHADQTRGHLERVGERLRARGTGPSRIKDLALRTGGLNVGGFFAAQPDTTVKLAGFAYAFENLEVAVYELLRRVAERGDDAETAAMAAAIAVEERATAESIAGTWERAMDARMEAVSGAGPGPGG